MKEDYLAHAGVALRFAVLLLGAGLAALVHALIPALFETSASSTIKKLHRQDGGSRACTAFPARTALVMFFVAPEYPKASL